MQCWLTELQKLRSLKTCKVGSRKAGGTKARAPENRGEKTDASGQAFRRETRESSVSPYFSFTLALSRLDKTLPHWGW